MVSPYRFLRMAAGEPSSRFPHALEGSVAISNETACGTRNPMCESGAPHESHVGCSWQRAGRTGSAGVSVAAGRFTSPGCGGRTALRSTKRMAVIDAKRKTLTHWTNVESRSVRNLYPRPKRGSRKRSSTLRPRRMAGNNDQTTSTVRNKNTKNHERCNHQDDHEKRLLDECGVLHTASWRTERDF
jgi:hypothetical protein